LIVAVGWIAVVWAVMMNAWIAGSVVREHRERLAIGLRDILSRDSRLG
jgi:hypothetical protein